MPNGIGLDNTIDLSHWNNVKSFPKIASDGIDLVFHKATQGINNSDKTYSQRRLQAESAGLKWGSYHFGIGADGSDQADHFLNASGGTGLLVLDFEPNPHGPTMTLDQAEEFVSYIKEAKGKYPGLYGGYHLKELMKSAGSTVLTNCWLWFARYGNAIVSPTGWKSWTFWQYTDGKNGPDPKQVQGVGHCDRNAFNGTKADFDSFLTLNTF